MRTLTIVTVVCVGTASCGISHGTSSDTPTPDTSGAAGNTGDPGAGVAPSAAYALVFNEVKGVGSPEWIEIANKGAQAIDLGGYAIADSSKKTNEPKRSTAMTFPDGTTIEPGGRLLVLTSKKGAVGPHPRAECLPDGPDSCFYAEFGVSASSGEALHVLAPDGSVVSTKLPPTPSADAGGSTTTTQCRLPDLTGDYGPCTPTPGEPNRAP